MAVKSKDEILNAIKERFKDDNSDDTLSFIEDISDTIDDMSEQVAKSGEWQKKYEQNDKEWREKYKERFFSKPVDEPDLDTETEPEPKKPMSFEDLFKSE